MKSECAEKRRIKNEQLTIDFEAWLEAIDEKFGRVHALIKEQKANKQLKK